MSVDHDVLSALEPFVHEGWISEVVREVKSGKEATVYCCRGGDLARHQLLAAKVYCPIETRRFRNDAMYQTGRMHLAREGRVKRAAESKSAFGLKVHYATWLDHEWEVMKTLHRVRADVPSPLARAERAILMPFYGDESGPAPILNDAEITPREAAVITDQLFFNIELMLDLHIVHGDLSPFNVLLWRGRAIIIDFPQAIDPRLNPSARFLLERDLAKICGWARKYGVLHDARSIAGDLWARFMLAEIG